MTVRSAPTSRPASAVDASLLHAERPDTPLHLTTVMEFGGEIALDDLVARIVDVVAGLPRYRCRAHELLLPPGRLVWWPDEPDVAAHVRELTLPEPGGGTQLDEFVARLHSRALPRTRPLWDVHLAHGLAGGGCAVVVRTHLALVDPTSGSVDLSQRLVDESPGTPGRGALPRSGAPVGAAAGAGGGPLTAAVRLAAGAVAGSASALAGAVRDPVDAAGRVVAAAGDTVRGAAGTARRTLRVAAGGGAAVLDLLAGPPVVSPLRATRTSSGRLVATATVPLARYRAVARAARARLAESGRGAEVSVHGVVLTTIAGAFRDWLVRRGVPVSAASRLRTLVPLAVTGPDGPAVLPAIVDLPIGEPDPVVRLGRVAYQLRRAAGPGDDGWQGVGARRLASVAGFAPPTLHALGARVARDLAHRVVDLVVTDVPGPQRPLHLVGERMTGGYPVIPLTPGHVVAVGLTSYDGTVSFGLVADRGAVPDAGTLAGSLTPAVDELSEALR